MFLILLPLPFTGIIPAHAGLTSAAAAHGLRVEDHPRGCGAHVKPSSGAASRAGSPRGCGAHSMDDIKAHMHQGSSPRVRGSRIYSRHQADGDGIIPADAGLTHADPTKWAAYRDHPRGCGAHAVCQRFIAFALESSPRMRGSRGQRVRRSKADGVIPADAGLTFACRGAGFLSRGHPRGCGAHPSEGPEGGSKLGSSPRMRGSLKIMNF